MKNNFVVNCPACEIDIDFGEYENWNDDFKDDAGPTQAQCQHCEAILFIKTDLTITLSLDHEMMELEKE